MPAPLKPIIYIAFANDLQNPGRNLTSLTQEQANIEAAIRDDPGASQQQDRLAALLQSWDLIAKDDLTPRSLTQPFYSNRVAIFHYGGHAGPEALLLETEDGKNVAGSAETIIPFFRDQSSLKLIFLNACSTKQWALTLTQNAGDDFCIIATSCPVQDPVAMQFAHDFYNCLAADGTIQEAFDKALHGANVNLTGATRDFGVQEHTTDGLPWALYPPGPSPAKSWRLSTALKDPLLGVPPLSADYKIPARPYVSIRGHEKEDAQIFFGRNAEIREIYDWATQDTTTPIMLFYGQSGSGKSSLLRAGVWPRLEARASIGYFRREEDLTDDLNLGLSSTTHIADPEQAATAWLHSDKPIVVLLDQVEEVITHSSAAKNPKDTKDANPANDELSRFFDRIVSVFIDPLTGQPRLPGTKARLILSFRKEYLAEIRNPIMSRIPSLVRDFWLDRLSEQNIIDIIEGPVLSDALRAQYKIALEAQTDQTKSFADSLVGRLYDPLSPVATILELELNRLWDLWHPTDPDKIAALQDPNGVFQQELQACRAQKDPLGRDQTDATLCYSRKIYDLVASSDALQQFVDDQVSTIDDPALNKGLELDLLYEHTSALSTSQRRSLSELRALYKGRIADADLDRLLVRNKDLQLLADVGDDDAAPSAAGTASAQNASQDTATVLSHDTLAPVIRREFYLSHNPGQRARRVLEDRARSWENKAKGDLLDAADLRTVRQGQRYMRAASDDEDRLITASKKRHRRNIALTTVTLVAVIGFFYYFAMREFDSMMSVRLADDATAEIANRYDSALLLSAAALWFQDTPEARQAILQVYAARPDALAVLYPQNRGLGTPAFSPDGKQMLITAGNTFELWDTATLQRLWTVQDSSANTGVFTFVAFSPDGREFAVEGFEKTQLWRTQDHQLLVDSLPAAPTETGTLSFSSDGKYLAAGGGCQQIQVWSLAPDHSPAPLRTLGKPCLSSLSIDRIAFDPADSGVLGAWSNSGEVWLENSLTGARLTSVRPPAGGPSYGSADLAFSADGTRLAAATVKGQIDLFNVSDRIKIGTIDAGVELKSFAFSPDGRQIAAAAGDGAIGIWDTDSLIAVKYRADGGSSLDQVTAFSPDLKTAAVKAQDGNVLLLDISRSRSPLPPTGPPLEDSVVVLAASPDGSWIATGTVNEYVTLWNARTFERVWTFNGQQADRQKFPSSISSLAFTPDSKILLFPRVDSTAAAQIGLHRFDIASRSLLPDLNAPRSQGEFGVQGIAVGPGGKIAAVADSGAVHLWDNAGKPTSPHFTADAGVPQPVVFSPDGKLLALEADDYSAIHLLDAAQPDGASRVLKGANKLEAESIAFAPGSDGSSGLLAAGGSHGFWLWNLANGQQTTGSAEYTKNVVFSPDGNLILLALQKSQVELWSIAAGKIVGAPLQDAGPDLANTPGGIAFSPDGKRMYAGEWRSTFRVWDWSTFPIGKIDQHMRDWPALACSIARRNFAPAELKQYTGPFVPYVRVCADLPVPK